MFGSMVSTGLMYSRTELLFRKTISVSPVTSYVSVKGKPSSIRAVAGDRSLKREWQPANRDWLEVCNQAAILIVFHVRLTDGEPLVFLITSQPELNLLKIVTVKRRFRTKDKVELQRLLVIVYTLMIG